ncbi:MAG: hypothetical protein B6229_03640 [Spirochaetaceae bacterium 4572_7]|nr:MAG: hypothetical protein B6229_03640 [Spirochaetaceae bacterium 4572_7]
MLYIVVLYACKILKKIIKKLKKMGTNKKILEDEDYRIISEEEEKFLYEEAILPVNDVTETEEDPTLLDVLKAAGFTIDSDQEADVYETIKTAASDKDFDLENSDEDEVIQFLQENKEVIFSTEKFETLIDKEEC